MTISIERVHPGQLIRARAFNDMADAIDDLYRLVEALGPVPGTDDKPEITHIDPEQPVEHGVMTIIGRNFAVPASLDTVTLDGLQLTGILPGSSDQQLRVTVPGGLPGLPADMLLEVETSKGVASRTVRILPETQIPAGKPTVTNATTGAGTIQAGADVTFVFRIDAGAVTIPETYRLQAVYTDVVGGTAQQWLNATRFIGAAVDEVTVNPVTPVDVGVKVTVPTGVTSASMTLRVISTRNDPGSSQSSAPVPIVVGEVLPENDPRISLFPGEMNGNTLRTGEDATTHELLVQVKYPTTGFRQVNIPINARFAVAGTYAYSASIEDPGALWTLVTVSPQSSPEASGGAHDLAIQVRLNTTTPAAERRNLTVTATRQETGEPGQISAYIVLPIEGFNV
jgi:hypothetical protein